MAGVNYRILVDSEKVRGLPAVRVVTLDGDGAGEVFAAKAEDRTAIDFAVDVDKTAAIYHGYLAPGSGEFVQVADPTSLTATCNPIKASPTPIGKLYWVGVATVVVVPQKPKKPVVAPLELAEVVLPEVAVVVPPVVPVVAAAISDAASEQAIVEIDIAPSTSQLDIEIDAYLRPDRPAAAPPQVSDKKDEGVTWMPVDAFAKLTLGKKRDYLRDIGIDGPVDMRTHTRMVDGYKEFFAARQR